ncbi:MAG: hypothetical protein BHV62_05665 [Eggerthella sp. 51_9]|nr:MAG: hypothetical protein BHV62_05665 [Eggerthella sp. 51_9]
MPQFQILGRRPLPFKAISIRFAYTNISDTLPKKSAKQLKQAILLAGSSRAPARRGVRVHFLMWGGVARLRDVPQQKVAKQPKE